MAGDRRNPPWAEMLQLSDDKHEDAHRRLRSDIRIGEAERDALTLRIQKLEREAAQTSQMLIDSKGAPIDLGLIVFNPKMVLAIIGLVVTILGGTWFINQPIVSRLDRFEERQASTKEAIDTLNKATEMRRLEIQSLSNQFQQFQLQQQRSR